MRKDLTLQQMLDGLLEFAEYFQRPDADFGEWESPPRQTPFAILSQQATDFLEACYELGSLESFNWARWSNTEEATELWDDPEALEIATAHQISRILTVILRQEHFSNVALMSAFESGYLQRVLRRIAALAAE